MTKVTISGMIFELPTPYEVGYILTEADARLMNGAYHDGVRNSTAHYIRRGRKEGKSEDVIIEGVNDFIKNYKFGVRRISGGKNASRVDPVVTAARNIAREQISDGLRAKGLKIRGRGEEINRLIDELIDREPQIMDLAQTRVMAAQSIASAALDDIINKAA